MIYRCSIYRRFIYRRRSTAFLTGPTTLLALSHSASEFGSSATFPQGVELRARSDVGSAAVGPLPYRLVELIQGVGQVLEHRIEESVLDQDVLPVLGIGRHPPRGIIIASDLQSCSSNATLSPRSRHPP